MNLTKIISNIQLTKQAFKQSAMLTVNAHLTIRNWLIGFYIVEFEQKGEDRAQYDKNIKSVLAENLADNCLSYSNLKVYRQFYKTYTSFAELVSKFLHKHFETNEPSLIAGIDLFNNEIITYRQSPIVQLQQNKKESISIVTDNVTDNVTEKGAVKLSLNQKKIANKILKKLHITSSEIASIIGIRADQIWVNSSKHKSLVILQRTRPDKGRHWDSIK